MISKFFHELRQHAKMMADWTWECQWGSHLFSWTGVTVPKLVTIPQTRDVAKF